MSEYWNWKLALFAVLAWLILITISSAWAGSARASPCLAEREDAGIIQHMLIAQRWPPERVKAKADGATDIDEQRKMRIMALVDEATAILAAECDQYDGPCKAAKSLDAWVMEVFAACVKLKHGTRLEAK